jgi:hypothetical protein
MTSKATTVTSVILANFFSVAALILEDEDGLALGLLGWRDDVEFWWLISFSIQFTFPHFIKEKRKGHNRKKKGGNETDRK